MMPKFTIEANYDIRGIPYLNSTAAYL